MNYISILTMSLSLFVGGQVYAKPVTLRDKIGQMLIVGFEGSEVNRNSEIIKQIKENYLGGVILFDYNPKTKLFDKNIRSPEQVNQLNTELQRFNANAQSKQKLPRTPLLIAVDYEGGNRGTRLNPAQDFPETPSAAMIGKMSLLDASQVAENMATTLQSEGFNLNFAPVLDVNVNPESPVIGKLGRSFSENPSDVANYARIFSHYYLSHHVQCAYKHFPGHGSATEDSHLGFVDVTNTWKPEELLPYVQVLEQDQPCGMVMTAHLVNRQLDESGLPATLSHKILTDLLRDKLHFKGVVITDDLQMKAITDHFSLDRAVTLAINAGADMLIFGNQLTDEAQDPEEIIDLIEAQVRAGEISERRINQAYLRIKAMKATINDI